MKNLRSSLILLVLVVLGGTYIYWAERGPATSPDAVILLQAPESSVQKVTLHPAGIIIERTGADSSFTVRDEKTGLHAPLDADEGKTLWSQIALVQSPLPVKNPEALAKYGLQNPQSSIEVDEQRLELGHVAPFDKTFVYARGNGQVALINTPLLSTTQQTFLQWRDRTILNVADIRSFVLRNGQGTLRFAKNPAGTWILNAPEKGILNAYVDGDIVESMASALSSAKIVKWLDETGKNPASYGLSSPAILFESGGLRLEIGKSVSGGYAARRGSSGEIFEIPSLLIGLLNRPLNEWRDKKIAHFALNAATRLEVEQGAKRKNLVKNGDNWQLEGGQSDQKTNDAALDLLTYALDLRASDFVDKSVEKAKFTTGKPVLTLRIVADDTTELRLERVGKALWVRRKLGTADFGMIFVLNEASLDATQDAMSQLFARPKT